MDKGKKNHWVAPDQARLPDFIIGGAMKCGTTTLSTILKAHPHITMAPREPHFFDIDNLLEHGDFNFYDESKDVWTSQSMTQDPETMWRWYFSKFDNNGGGLKGEDSTCYLCSPKAAERIALQDKAIKLIFVLRNPAERAYSQYLHMLRSGRATYTFEDTLRFDPFSIVWRSMYKDQLARYYDCIPKERIKVLLFEELVENTAKIIEEVCLFLGVDFSLYKAEIFSAHANRAHVPKYPYLQMLVNRFLRGQGNKVYSRALPFTPNVQTKKTSVVGNKITRFFLSLNPLVETKTYDMKRSTRCFLNTFFKEELAGIDELVGRDIQEVWFSENRGKD